MPAESAADPRSSGSGTKEPLVSVIVLNYNGARWLQKCLESLRTQTIFDQTETIVADNASTDKSDDLAADLMRGWPNGRVMRHGANFGYCEGNNRAARAARGEWLFFLNNDAWLEPRCLEILVSETKAAGAEASGPLVLDYEADTFQSLGAGGFDLFGFPTSRLTYDNRRPVFMPEGCAYLIRRGLFEELGGFDPEFFMYVDEYDLSWRVWISGRQAVAVPSARLHHRGAAQVNPAGAGTVVELRTSDMKRYYTNRNSLLAVLKNAQHLMLLMVPLQLCLLMAEMAVATVVIRRWSFIRKAYFGAVADCWRLRHHVRAARRQIRQFRKRSDWEILGFLKGRFNRWDELKRIRQLGLPKVTAS